MAHDALHARLFALAAAALFTPMAQADCVDGIREPRAAEQEFHRRATAALIAALPAPPVGAEAEGTAYDFKRLPSIGVLCRGDKVGDFTIGVQRRYVIRVTEAESRRLYAPRKAIDDQIQALLRLPPDRAAERSALERQSTAVDYSRSAALKAGDKATAEARLAEANSLNAAAMEVGNRYRDSVKPQVDAMLEQRKAFEARDQLAVVHIEINLSKLPAAANNPFWAYGSASPQRNAALKVVNVVWNVGGPASPLRDALAAAMPETRLKALVAAALPSEAESEALAARAVPPARPALATPKTDLAPNSAASTAPAAAITTAQSPTPVVAPPAPAPAAAPTTAAAPPAPDPLKQAAGALQSLRGLLGR